MSRFVAFDVETPNRMSNRMSAVGITVVEDGKSRKAFIRLSIPRRILITSTYA